MQNTINQIYNVDNIEFLNTLGTCSVDNICTDVPYGLQDIDGLKLIKTNTNNTRGFMGKTWDCLPTIPFLKECHRVLKDGAFFVTTFSPRQDLQCVFSYRLLEAGFDINFTPILWCFACLSEDSEVYTKQYGWINLMDLQKRLDNKKTSCINTVNEIEILVYDKNTCEYRWEVPHQWNIYYNTDTAYRIASDKTDQIVSRGHNCLIEREGKLSYRTPESLWEEGELVCTVPYLADLSILQWAIHSSTTQNVKKAFKVLFQRLQAERRRFCNKNKTKYCSKEPTQTLNDGGKKANTKGKYDGRQKSRLEGWYNIFTKEGKLCLSINKICEMSARVYCNGKKRWLGCVTSFIGCNNNTKTIDKHGVCASYKSQCGGQQSRKSNVIQEQQRTQTIRGGKGYNTTLATITKIKYKGMIYCPTTQAGSFVARRNGKIFITGNSGFPKASDYQKGTTKRGEPEQTSEYLSGLKSLQLKPAYEVVIIAQKPYKAKSKIDQALVWYNERKDLLDKDIKEEDLYLYTRNASGGVRIDKNEMFDGVMSSRIPIENIESENGWSNVESYNKSIYTNFNVKREAHNEGRFPATILTGSPIDFDGQDILELHTTQTTSPVLFELLDYIGLTLDDFKTLSAEELQGIIARLKKPLDVGRERKGGGAIKDCDKTIFNNYTGKISNPAQDSGDLSRYFSLDAWTKKNLPELYKISKKTLELQEDAEKISPFLFTSKPDKGTKNAGLEEFETKEKWLKSGGGVGISERQTMAQNTHPTGKSIALYSYLINLFTHPHDLVLDPYCGSGTTPIACVLTNRHYIGLELEKEYFDIAEARVKHWEGQLNIQKQHVISTQTTQENANLFEDNV